MYYGPLAALTSELFTVTSRATGLGFSYNMGVTLFGGMEPVTWPGSVVWSGTLPPPTT